MNNKYWCSALLFRIIFPCIIASAVFIRPTISSYIYMVMGCYMPFYSVPTPGSMARSTGVYMKCLIIVCVLVCSMVFSFYFVLYFVNDNEQSLKPCSPLEITFRTIGIVDYQGLPFSDAVTWCLPEPLMLVTSLLMYWSFKKLGQTSEKSEAKIRIDDQSGLREIHHKKLMAMMLNFGKYLVCLLLCLIAVLKATALGLVYYVVFLGVVTYWACNKPLGEVFGRILVCLTPIVYLHITIMFFYQFQFFQDSEVFTTTSIAGRLFHLVDLKTYQDCDDPRLFKFHAQAYATYAVLFCLFFLYNINILVARQIFEAKDGIINLLLACFYFEGSASARWRRALKKLKKQIENEKSKDFNLMADRIGSVIEQISQFVISIAGLIGNFIMMFWAILYIGWTSLILLMWANLIWLLPSRKKIMLMMSPFLVVYVQFVLLINYLHALDLTEEELLLEKALLDVTADATKSSGDKWKELLTKSVFGAIIIVAMRQLWQEKAAKKHEADLANILREAAAQSSSAAQSDDDETSMTFINRFQNACVEFLAIWWIWIVIITMIWMCFWSTSDVFKISFVGLAMLFLSTFHLCPFKFWKKFLSLYWWIVIIYAMFNLLVAYMYQITATKMALHRYVSEEDFDRFGFRAWTNANERVVELAKPFFFQILIVIQQNYFQKEFNALTSPISPEEVEKEEKGRLEDDTNWKKLKSTFRSCKDALFAALEVHLLNVTLLMGWLMCFIDICATFAPLVVLFTAACVLGRRLSKVIIYATSIFVQVFIVLRLVYMNLYRQHDKWNYVGHYERNGEPFNVTLNTADWLGFHMSSYGHDYADFGQLIGCFSFVFVVTLNHIVAIRMRNYRVSRNLPSLVNVVLFPDITYENCHSNTLNLLKFLANYGFYKFGCEISLIYASVVMGLRMDVVSIIISFWLLILFGLNRTWMKRLWLIGVVVLAVAVPVEYVTTLGLWPSYFDRSLTKFWNANDFRLRLQQFCSLMNMAHPPTKRKISLDFLLLLIMSRQWHAFQMEWQLLGQEWGGGSNEDVSLLIDEPGVKNPVPDFVTYTKDYLDGYKRVFFITWFYLALMAVFLAGSMRPTLYSFGYLIGAFMFLWEGSDFFLRPPKQILFRWNLLIAYNVLIMMTRTVSQIFGCILKYESHIEINCAAYTLFTIGCVDKYGMTEGVPNVSKSTPCQVSYESLGLGWDCFSFFCLICQQRIFKSFHFFHVANNVKAQNILADRGAELIEDSRRKRRQTIENERIAIEGNIKRKMERIRANASKIAAIRAGQYQLFDEVEKDTDVPLLPPKEEEDIEYDSYDPMPLMEYFGLFIATDLDTVLEITAMRSSRKRGLKRGGAKQPKTSIDDTEPLSKTVDILRFIWGAFESCIVSVTGVIARRTKIFRDVLVEMDKDRRILKEETDFEIGVRLGTNNIWHPARSYKDILFLSNLQRGSIQDKELQHPICFKLLRALWYLMMAYSEWLCYVIIILNQTLRSNFLSIPLVIITFCWGALTVPRPTKTFWIVSIAYILIMVFIKIFSNMGFSPWTFESHADDLFFPPAFIGLRNRNHVMNVMLLIVFFFHRMVLQILGLWKPFNYRTSALIEEGDYIFRDGQLVPRYMVSNKNQRVLTVKNEIIPIGDYFPKSIFHGLYKYAETFKLYMQQLISPCATQVPVDVYTPMFLCDLINLFLLTFYYGSFEDDEENAGLISFISNNRVPIPFIVVILSYFLLMTIDRWLYMRKNRFGKLIFYFFQVISFHIWLFVIYPLATNRRLSRVPVVQMFYIFKCFYFLFSAYQIRNGYPTLISFHYLWHGYTVFHQFAYKIYRIIPYFLEIRCLLDWICSDSCLGIPAWFKLEDITKTVFIAKCKQQLDKKWAEPAGQPQNRVKKYFLGGFLFCVLVLTIIFPFLLFSLSSTVGVTTRPLNVKVELYMGSAEPIFVSYSTSKSRHILTEEEYQNLSITFNNIQHSENLFGAFKAEDVMVVKWSGHSLTTWDISPGSRQELLEDLEKDDRFNFRLEIHYTHVGHGGQKSSKLFGQSTRIPPLPDVQRKTLIDMMKSSNGSSGVVALALILPKFLMITKESTSKVLSIMENPGGKVVRVHEDFISEDDDDEDVTADATMFRNLLVSLQPGAENWWYVTEECSLEDDNYLYYLRDLVHNDCEDITIYLFNEKVFSGAMQYMTQSGILGLYLLYFMVVIEIIRECVSDMGEIWLTTLPNPDRVLRKCMEIYVARDMNNYELEDEIFEELISIMRSHEMLIKLTRFEDNNYNAMFSMPTK